MSSWAVVASAVCADESVRSTNVLQIDKHVHDDGAAHSGARREADRFGVGATELRLLLKERSVPVERKIEEFKRRSFGIAGVKPRTCVGGTGAEAWQCHAQHTAWMASCDSVFPDAVF